MDEQQKEVARRLAALFTAAGVKPGDTVVTYCHIGQQATAAFAARTLGFKVLAYDGLFEDWSRRPSCRSTTRQRSRTDRSRGLVRGAELPAVRPGAARPANGLTAREPIGPLCSLPGVEGGMVPREFLAQYLANAIALILAAAFSRPRLARWW
jgi:hypothetical protein